MPHVNHVVNGEVWPYVSPSINYRAWKRWYRQEHPEYREKARQYSKYWAKTYSDKRLLYSRKYHKQNPEKACYDHAYQRCNNPNNKTYVYYGGRGIKMIFKSYLEIVKDIGKRPNASYSLDRINNDGNYTAGNIRWATAKEQAANQRPRRKRLCRT